VKPGDVVFGNCYIIGLKRTEAGRCDLHVVGAWRYVSELVSATIARLRFQRIPGGFVFVTTAPTTAACCGSITLPTKLPYRTWAETMPSNRDSNCCHKLHRISTRAFLLLTEDKTL